MSYTPGQQLIWISGIMGKTNIPVTVISEQGVFVFVTINDLGGEPFRVEKGDLTTPY